MKIYTKKGDAGESGLIGNVRVPKDHLRLRAYGSLDELNACLGVVLAEKVSESLRTRLLRVQGEIFQLGAELATPREKKAPSGLLGKEDVQALESEIDSMEESLEPLRNFILPGGSRAAAMLHLARTVSRRAEREIVTLHHEETLRPEALEYMNRLSDYLFVSARFASFEAGIGEVAWRPR